MIKKILLYLSLLSPFFATSQKAVLTIQTGHSAIIKYASFTPDQTYSLTVDEEGVAILWHSKTGKQLTTRQGVHAAEFAKDGQSIYWAMTNRTFFQTNLEGTIIQNFEKDNDRKYEFYPRYFYPEEGLMLYRDNLFNFKTGKKTTISSGYNFYSQRYFKEIKQIVVGNEGKIAFFDAQSGASIKDWTTDKMGHLWTLSLSKDLNKILIGDRSVLKIRQLETGAELAKFTPQFNYETIYSAEYLPDGKSIFLFTQNSFYHLDATNLKVLSKKEHDLERNISVYTSSPTLRITEDGKRVFLGHGQNGFWVNISTLIVEKKLNGIPFTNTHNLKIDPVAKELSHTEGDNLMVFWNLKTGIADKWTAISGIRAEELDPVLEARQTPFNSKMVGSRKPNPAALIIVEQKTKKEVFAQKIPNSFSFSNDFSKIVTANNDTITVRSLPLGKIDASHVIPFSEKDPKNSVSITDLVISKDNKTVSFFVTIPTDNANLEKLKAVEITTGKILFSIDKRIPNDRVGEKYITHAQLKPNNKTLATGTFDGFIRIFDVSKTGEPQEIKTIKAHDGRINSIEFSPSGKFFFTASSDHKIKVWRTNDWSLAATMHVFASTKDWAVITPEGQFEATKGAMDNMYFLKKLEVLPLSSLYEKFYTPHLLTRILEGETFEPLPVKVDDLKQAPTVKIKFKDGKRNLIVESDLPSVNTENREGQITVDAVSVDDVISEIRLYHNGKLLGSGTRNLVVEDDDKLEKNKTQLFDIQLVEGENKFKAIALNSQRTESQPDEIILNFKSKTAPSVSDGSASGIQLHLVIVGINKYKNPKYNLNYATADATSFKEAIEKGGTSIFSKTNVVFIGDEKATKAGISDELEKVKAAAKPHDVFIFYYAGHGVLNQKKDFFLVPHDVTQLYGQDDALAQKGLSANQLQQFSKDIKAQKQLFILDACQSAGALDQIVVARGAAEEKAIAQLARATGTHWLTASGSEQFASEFTQLGHGTFTYVLLEALSGKADKGGDKKITVKELDAYLQEVVPELTAKYKGTPQYPASYGFGNDFPIGVVKQ